MINRVTSEIEANKDNIVIGLCLEFKFLQELLSDDLGKITSFIEDNKEYFNFLTPETLLSGISSFNSLFYSFTDVVFYDLDNSEKFLHYHKDYF